MTASTIPALVWNLWWAKHALVDALQNPFACDWIFWPVGINLAFYTLTLLNGVLALPLQAVAGLIPAYNLLLLASFVLGGYGAFLLALDFLARRPAFKTAAVPAAFLAGAFYAFAGSKMFYAALGQGNIASSQYAPFAMLYLVRAARRGGRPRDAVLAALFLSLQAYAELTFASFLLLFAVLVWVWHALARRPSALRALFTRGALVAVLFVLAVSPVLANMLPDLRRDPDLFASGGGFADIFSADLAGYALPTQLHPLLGNAIRTLSHGSAPQPDGRQFAVDKGQQVFLGYVALALAVIGIARARTRERWLWMAAAAFFFLLTLGPELRIAGRAFGIPLPFALVERLPFFQGNRYPGRYSVLLLASLAPLVAAGAAAVLSRLPRRSLWAVAPALLALLLFEHLSAPLPLSDQTVPPIYRLVAAEPGDGRAVGAAVRLAKRCARAGQKRCADHAGAALPDRARQAHPGREHLAQS